GSVCDGVSGRGTRSCVSSFKCPRSCRTCRLCRACGRSVLTPFSRVLTVKSLDGTSLRAVFANLTEPAATRLRRLPGGRVMATQQAKDNMQPGFFERLGDKFTSFVEWCVNLIAKLMGGSSNERVIKNLGYVRPKNADAHAITPGSVLGKVN